MEKNEAIKNAKNFDEILDIQYGKIGTDERHEFEDRARRFIIGQLGRKSNVVRENLTSDLNKQIR